MLSTLCDETVKYITLLFLNENLWEPFSFHGRNKLFTCPHWILQLKSWWSFWKLRGWSILCKT